LMPPGFPVKIETGSSSTGGGAGSKFEQETRRRKLSAGMMIFMGISNKKGGRVTGPLKIAD